MSQITENIEQPLQAAENTTAQTNQKTAARKGLLWLVFAAVLWGTVGVSSALLNRVETTPPLTVGFLRMAFSAPFLCFLAWVTNGRNPFKIKGQDLPLFIGIGLAMAGYQVFYFIAIPISNVTLVVVVALCSAPLIVALLSIPIFKEKLTIAILFSLVLALVGTGLLAFGGNDGKSGEFFKPEYLLGALLALGAGFSYSCLTIISRIAARRSHADPIQTLAISFSLSALMLLIAAIISGSLRLNLAPGVWLISAYLGIVPTGITYIIFLKALKSASATAAAITTLLEPAIAAILAWLILGETITILTIIGGGLLLASVFLLSRKE